MHFPNIYFSIPLHLMGPIPREKGQQPPFYVSSGFVCSLIYDE